MSIPLMSTTSYAVKDYESCPRGLVLRFSPTREPIIATAKYLSTPRTDISHTFEIIAKDPELNSQTIVLREAKVNDPLTGVVRRGILTAALGQAVEQMDVEVWLVADDDFDVVIIDAYAPPKVG